MGLPRADRRTLLRLMADEGYQQTKLGAAFPPHKQQRSSLFWRLAAAYLEQPLMAVMVAGMSLHADADRLWRKQREDWRQQHRRQQGAAARSAPAAPLLPWRQPAAPTPSVDKVLPTPELEAEATGGSRGSVEQRRSKHKGEPQHDRQAAAPAAAAAAAEGGGGGQAGQPALAAKPQLPPAAKKHKRKAAGTGSAQAIPAGLPPAAGASGQAGAAERQQPAAKKKRRQEAGGGSAAGGPAGPQPTAPAAADAEADVQQQAPYDPFSGAFAAFRPLEAAPAAPAVAAAPAARAVAAPAAAAVAAAHPPSAKRRWLPEADTELLLLAGSAEQRQRVLGSAELDWNAIGGHFGRSGSAAQAHWCRVSQAASGAQASAGSAAAAATAEDGQLPGQQQQAAAGGGHTASGAEAQELARSSDRAPAASQPVRVALNFGLPPSAEQHERPPFVGVKFQKDCQLCWASDVRIQGKQWRLASCASRAGAAAAHDVARIWCRLHGKEVRETGMNVNFPQLLEDGALELELRHLADVPALKAFLDSWTAQHWPQMEVAMLAGRAAALDRYIAATSRRLGIRPSDYGWRARISLLGGECVLGTWPTATAAGVVRDVGSVWRSLHVRSTSASQLYNHPQLRLWEDAALLASLRGIQSGEQLQGFVKGWARQHLPAMLDRLAQQGAAAAAAAP